jgi:hypothetical protein
MDSASSTTVFWSQPYSERRAFKSAKSLNLGLVMRHMIGFGTARGLQGRVAAVLAMLLALIRVVRRRLTAISSSQRLITAMRGWLLPLTAPTVNSSQIVTYTTGC